MGSNWIDSEKPQRKWKQAWHASGPHKPSKFWLGYFAALAVTGLMQDIIGKEDYLRMARDNWVSSPITIPLELAVLVWVGYSLLKEK